MAGPGIGVMLASPMCLTMVSRFDCGRPPPPSLRLPLVHSHFSRSLLYGRPFNFSTLDLELLDVNSDASPISMWYSTIRLRVVANAATIRPNQTFDPCRWIRQKIYCWSDPLLDVVTHAEPACGSMVERFGNDIGATWYESFWKQPVASLALDMVGFFR